MGRRKLTEEEKLQREEAKKAKKIAERQAKIDAREAEWKARQAVWAKQAEESREVILSQMEETFKDRFIKSVEYVKEHCQSNAFFSDIINKWMRFGKLSEKQMQVLVECVERDRKKVTINEVAVGWFARGDKAQLKNLHVVSIKEVVVEQGTWHEGTTTAITLKNKAGIFFKVKSNRKTLIEQMESIKKNDGMVNIVALVNGVYGDTVHLSAKGIKVS